MRQANKKEEMMSDKEEGAKIDLNKIISDTIPALAVAPTACVIYAGLLTILPIYPEPFAAAGGLAIELIGFRTMSLSTKMIAFNDANKNKDERDQFNAPVNNAYWLVAAYLVITVTIALVLHAHPIAAFFPFLGIAGGWLHGLQTGQEEREQGREKMRAKKRTKPAGASKPKRTAKALREECIALDKQYACTEPQCGWSPKVERLLTKKSPKRSAPAMKAGHIKNQHAPIPIDKSLLVEAK